MTRSTPIFNIEVHGKHAYQVGMIGIVLHNAGERLVRLGQNIESVADLAADA